MTEIYIGLLSGTSVDSIDAILVDFTSTNMDIIKTHNHPIPQVIRDTVFNLALSGNNEIELVSTLDQEYGKLFGEAAITLCEKANLNKKYVSAIGSHGQTIRHYPPSKKQLGYSLQIGDPNIIAEVTGITTVTDFRRRDIAAGGHGAPLTPAFHANLFHSEEFNRIILNTGGIANITWLPSSGEIIGFDTGPANGLMDSWCQRFLNQPFDKNGEWASQGTVDQAFLSILLSHPYFKEPAPKTTGRETFNLNWLDYEISQYPKEQTPESIQATLLALTTTSIAKAIEELDPNNQSAIYICGGGSNNTELCRQLSTLLSPRKFSSTSKLGLDPNWVEAAAFAWLAKQTIEHKAGNLPSVTGALKKVILGGIYWAQ